MYTLTILRVEAIYRGKKGYTFFNKFPDSTKFVIFKNKLDDWLVLNSVCILDEFVNCNSDVTL